MRIRVVLFVMVTLFAGFLFAACSESREKAEQRAAVANAIKALRKIDEAKEGVSYLQYKRLCDEAGSKVDEARAKLPDGELKKSLNLSAVEYAVAASFWESKNNNEMSDSKADSWIQAGWAAAKEHLDKAIELAEK